MLSVLVQGFDRMGWDDMFPRQFKQGECEGWCSESFMVLVARPFTQDEDAGFKWVSEQDVVELVGVMPLKDGRDLMMFDRCFVKQTREEARKEQVEFIRKSMDRKEVKVDLLFP